MFGELKNVDSPQSEPPFFFSLETREALHDLVLPIIAALGSIIAGALLGSLICPGFGTIGGAIAGASIASGVFILDPSSDKIHDFVRPYFFTDEEYFQINMRKLRELMIGFTPHDTVDDEIVESRTKNFLVLIQNRDLTSYKTQLEELKNELQKMQESIQAQNRIPPEALQKLIDSLSSLAL